MKFSTKGQAATEFLLTYGWAFLAISIAIAALGYFGVFTPKNLAPDECIFETGFICSESIVRDNHNIFFKLVNNQDNDIEFVPGSKITISGIQCTVNPDTDVVVTGPPGRGSTRGIGLYNLCSGGTYVWPRGTTVLFSINCPLSSIKKGDRPKVQITLNYRYSDSVCNANQNSWFIHTSTGTVASTHG